MKNGIETRSAALAEEPSFYQRRGGNVRGQQSGDRVITASLTTLVPRLCLGTH